MRPHLAEADHTLRKYLEWDEREINQVVDQRMASTAPGIPVEDVMRETQARSE